MSAARMRTVYLCTRRGDIVSPGDGARGAVLDKETDMAGLDDILNSLPIDEIASKLGVDPDTARRAVQEGGATILSGLQHNAQTPDGSAAIEQALSRHSGMGDSVDVNAVDTADGQKILGHIFGSQEPEVAQKLTDAPQTAGIDFGKLLPMLAPIVMGLLAKNQGGQQTAAPSGGSSGGSSGGIGDLIGGLLGGGGGGTAPAAQSGGGIDIGGLIGGLGGLFGGGKS
jgi:hypothetical protein